MLTCLDLSLENYNQLIFKKLGVTFFPGSLYLLKGRNGSGKSSLLKTIAGIINPTEGKILWRGKEIEDLSVYISYLGHENAMKDNLSVAENLEFWASLRNTESLILPALAQFGLFDYVDTKFGDLSAGIQRKVALSRMIISNTQLWLLDEPEANLDKPSREQLIKLLQVKISNGGMAIMVTHQEEEFKLVPCINMDDFKYE